MTILHIDFETRSTVDLLETGVHKYATDPTTDVWMAAMALGDEPVWSWFPGEPLPQEVIDHITAGRTVCAHNASFEWHIIEFICAPRHGWPHVAPEQLDCTAARAAIMALPRSLAQAAPALGLRIEKDDAGRRLMLQMCRPRRVEANGTPVWWDDPKKIQRLEEYCRRDLEVERELDRVLQPITPSEREIWLLDFYMNLAGVSVDLRLVKRAGLLLEKSMASYNAELTRLTGGAVTAVTAVAAITGWLHTRGVNVASLDKAAVRGLLSGDLDPAVRRVLEIRREAGKSSTAKLLSFAHRTSADGRMRENLMYHGASTGRWAGRGVQLQNLPRPELSNTAVAGAISLIRACHPDTLGDAETAVEAFYGPVPTVTADLLRGCVVAAPGSVLYASDFANIEGRVLAWVAGQADLVEAFARDGKIYEAMAAAVYDVPVDSIGKDSKERRLGKTAVLGCGYGMGWAKFMDTCAGAGISVDEDLARRAIETYRRVNNKIVEFWYGLEDAAVRAVSRLGVVTEFRGVKFVATKDWLRCRLPSGRDLWYREPRVEKAKTPWGAEKDQLSFMGVESTTKRWLRQRTYGGALTENVVQALARDLLAAAMLRINARFVIPGMKCVLSVHDEIIAEAPADCSVTVAEFEACMAEVPRWATGCPVKAAGGFRAERYRK